MLSTPSPDNSVHQFQDQTGQSLWSTDTNKSGLADEGNHLSEATVMAPTGTQVVRSSPTTVSGLLTSLGGTTGPSPAGKDGLSFEMDLSRRMKVVEESLRLQTALGVSHLQQAEKTPQTYGLPLSARTPVRDLRRRRNKALHEVKPVTKTETADIQAMENRVGMAGNVIKATTGIGIDEQPLTTAKNAKLLPAASRARDTDRDKAAAQESPSLEAMPTAPDKTMAQELAAEKNQAVKPEEGTDQPAQNAMTKADAISAPSDCMCHGIMSPDAK